MSPVVAAIAFTAGIVGLFYLDRGRHKNSLALWIPAIWISIACSRPVAAWLGAEVDSGEQVLEGSPLDRLVFSILFAFAVIVLLRRRKQVGRLLQANWVIVLFLCYCALSLLWSDYPGVAFKRLIKAVGDFVIVLVVLSDAEPVAAFQRVLKRMTYVLIPLSVLFIKYYPNLGVQWSPWGGKAGYGGVTTNKNTLGAICLCFGLGCLWRFVDAWKHREMPRRTAVLIAQIGVLFMIMWLFWITDSKTSLLTFIMGGTVLIAANSRMVVGRRWMLHLLIVTMLFISSSVVFLGASPEALKAMGRNPTLTDRTEVWGVLLTLVTNPVFGTGFESFWLGPRLERMWSLYWWHPGEAHNGYLEIYLNLGWVGVLLLVAVIIISYRAVFRAWGRHPMATLAMAYVYSGLVYNFTEAAFFRMLAPTWIFFLFGVTAAALRTKIDPFTSPITASADSSSSAGATVTCDAVA